MQYKVIRSDYLSNFETTITEMLNSGWKLVGTATYFKIDSGIGFWYQTLVKDVRTDDILENDL